MIDSVGYKHGTIKGVGLTRGPGIITFPGGIASGAANVPYVDLPNGLISSIGNSISIEAWYTYTGPGYFEVSIFHS